MKAYEGMFIFDPAAAVEWANVEAEINRLIGRVGGQLIACKRWDERRLAYEIRGRKRGYYVLSYFRAPPDRIAALERDIQLSEHILRALLLRADHLTEEEMKAAVEKSPEPPAEGDRWDRGERTERGERPERGGRGRGRREAEAAPKQERGESAPGPEPAAEPAPVEESR